MPSSDLIPYDMPGPAALPRDIVDAIRPISW